MLPNKSNIPYIQLKTKHSLEQTYTQLTKVVSRFFSYAIG